MFELGKLALTPDRLKGVKLLAFLGLGSAWGVNPGPAGHVFSASSRMSKASNTFLAARAACLYSAPIPLIEVPSNSGLLVSTWPTFRPSLVTMPKAA